LVTGDVKTLKRYTRPMPNPVVLFNEPSEQKKKKGKQDKDW